MTLACVLWFVVGLFVGTNLGVGLMCLFIISGRCAQREETIVSNFERTLDAAKKYSLEHPEDCHLAIYMVRDYQELRDVGLDDMAWTLHREGYVSPGDAAWFFEEIDKRLVTGDIVEVDILGPSPDDPNDVPMMGDHIWTHA